MSREGTRWNTAVHEAGRWVVGRALGARGLGAVAGERDAALALVAALEAENAGMRWALRRIRDDDEPTLPERDAAVDALGDDLSDYPRDAVVIAAAVLAELDPLAPDERPVADLPLPEPQCVTCGDTGYVKPRAGLPYETCTCTAGPAFALPEPEEGQR
jgi:hypothetical protein